MRIILWNIRAGGGRRVGAILGQLSAWAPDVVALCEFRDTPPSRELARGLAGHGLPHQRHTIAPLHPAQNRLLVASRWPLRRLRLPREPAEPGRWLLVQVAAPQPIALGLMHVPNRVTGRKYPFLDAVLGLARRWQRGPALFLGDTNSGCRGIDEETVAFNAREDGWIASLALAGWADGFRRLHGQARVYSWHAPNGGNGFRIDQAFLNPALCARLRAARYVWGTRRGDRRRPAVSDHAALLVELDVGRSGRRDRGLCGFRPARAVGRFRRSP
jgi:exodeoxyribonuclease III